MPLLHILQAHGSTEADSSVAPHTGFPPGSPADHVLHRRRQARHLPGDVGLPAAPRLTQVLQHRACLVLLHACSADDGWHACAAWPGTFMCSCYSWSQSLPNAWRRRAPGKSWAGTRHATGPLPHPQASCPGCHALLRHAAPGQNGSPCAAWSRSWTHPALTHQWTALLSRLLIQSQGSAS